MGKRQKTKDARCHDLISLGRASFVSKSGIEKLLSSVKKDGLPDAFDRRSQYRARKHVCQTQTPYGKLVETMPMVFTAEPGTIPFQNQLTGRNSCLAAPLLNTVVAALQLTWQISCLAAPCKHF